jgi:ribose transport system substrate-binding protein
MSQQRFALAVLALLALVAAAWYRSQVFTEAPAKTVSQLVLVTGGTNPYWQLLGSGAQAACKDLGVKVQVKTPDKDEDVASQVALLLEMNPDAMDGVAISPLDAEKETRMINRLAEKTFVVTVDSDAPLSNRLSYVGASNLDAGRKCAQMVKEALPEGGKLAVLLANLTKDNVLERKRGLEETLAQPQNGDDSPSYEVVAELIDEGDLERCENQIKQVLADHADLAGIVGLNAYHGPALMKVLKDDERLKALKLITFDNEEETLAGIEAGSIFATIAQDPYQYGYEAMRVLASYNTRDNSQLPLTGAYSTVTISTQPIRQENLAEFRKSLEKRLPKPAEK